MTRLSKPAKVREVCLVCMDCIINTRSKHDIPDASRPNRAMGADGYATPKPDAEVGSRKGKKVSTYDWAFLAEELLLPPDLPPVILMDLWIWVKGWDLWDVIGRGSW
jgi:hypothetical protein